jgi:steroid delta-isomerase-like uncharacterized protein
MSQDSRTVARRWFEEVWNQRRIDLVEELTSPEVRGATAWGESLDRDAFKQRVYGEFLCLLPDLRITIEAMIVDGFDVAVRWLAEGTHTGSAFGLEATGRPVSMRGVTWFVVRDGRIVDAFDSWNVGGLMQQLQ